MAPHTSINDGKGTGGFSERNIIGEGGLGMVYMVMVSASSKISMAQTMSALVCNNLTTHAIDENVLMFIALLGHLTIAYDIHAKTVECIHALRCTIAVALAQVAKNA
ncbi:hypothetical protein OsI_12132 [Oryza sativa Indica Group]|uniref:Uncharacterized protein n=1 Tax=Oryza sativa subsp. indica TaxID=39946 RepID=B8AKH1_ORYSI|nr:hypothetical protein OsI_12132 [Oryza sativa Indica Group]